MPTSCVVLDSGILLATAQQEPNSERAKALIKTLTAQGARSAAPSLLSYEMISVVREWVYRALVKPEEAETILVNLLNYPVELHSDEALVRRAYGLAAAYQRPAAYDSQYLALAECLQCDFWTNDERLFNAVKSQFSVIRWLGAFN